ncbi:phosphoglucosamine mutase [Heliomicrobium modesticaldum Ice1]|uniref:Phosphoglucosamine mutase n=1 Tax=Heliobacterium modesticaldum (strain ATCC 51547 / Ice1) TaxID=498761 RepID=GLMM_HELMI|nr:phosphoglucosamine mutase [Heliomicrobium modesticaldum]B0TCS1.1 RecName: Full=Phosphoglucosamine mutase [Heliomicrobium modesticaldum Ice1]ABZ84097.1 phosphoglucosamine mutase [Heliomicrobium modesticaldum Ice1]
MGKLFGTDGVRGVANSELTPELAFKLGRAGAYVLSKEAPQPRIVIGKDTRISGDMLEAALIAGITSVGGEALPVGVLPTPGIAYLTRKLKATAGVVISASHNPVADNGIKFFSASGFKLPDAVEEEIERYVLGEKGQSLDNVGGDAEGRHDDGLPAPTGALVGRVRPVADAETLFVEYLKSTVPVDFSGLKVVVDGANGAAYQVAPRILRELGAEVVTICCTPDGTNINDGCGSTHPEKLCEAVVAHGAHVGLAHDGDADRLIAVDEKGRIVDGDRIMVTCALHMKAKGQLPKDTVAVTVMSNMGLHLALKRAGIRILETKVGDRYVLEALLREGASFGGEQSGHILFLQHNTTGDGVLTGLQLLTVLKETGKPLSELAAQMEQLPQLLVNVRVKDKGCMNAPEAQAAVEAGKAKLAGRGRILVRPSGTEPLIRVMGEGPDPEELKQVVEAIADVFRRF